MLFADAIRWLSVHLGIDCGTSTIKVITYLLLLVFSIAVVTRLLARTV